MLTPRKMQYDKAGPKVAEALNKRHFEAYYCPDRAAAIEKVLELISLEDTVSWGGTLTVDELGLKDLLRARGQKLIDRDTAQSGEEREELMRKGLLADTFLTSSNAVTADGQLFNIDGNGNRVAAFCFGPKQVIVVAGMNKVVPDMDAAYSRVRSYTAPGVVQRFPAAPAMSRACAPTAWAPIAPAAILYIPACAVLPSASRWCWWARTWACNTCKNSCGIFCARLFARRFVY